MDKNKVVVTVHGREYTLVGAEPVDYMQRVAGYVDRRMSEISYASYLPEDRLMALTALNLADELLKSKDEVTAPRNDADASGVGQSRMGCAHCGQGRKARRAEISLIRF